MNAPTYIEAARGALDRGLGDDRLVIMGEDVAEGGPFGLTKDLAGIAAGRVRNTPISEGAVMGVAVGMALGGRTPFVDLMFDDFLTLASDQLFNHAAKIHFMSGGAFSVPLTVWTIGGAGTRWGAQHSQRLEGWLAQMPGLKVLAPSTPAAVAASVTAALDDPDPVVVFADRSLLYSRKELGDEPVDPWRSRIVRRGDRLTVAATGRLVHAAAEVADRMGDAVEVVDLQRLAPLDVSVVCASVERTSRLLVLSDEAGDAGLASAVVARVQAQAFWHLDSPIRVLASPATPVPAAAELEDAFVLSAEDVEAAIRKLIDE